MLFLIQCFDREGAAELRQRVRPAHLAYLEAQGDRLKLAGPRLDGERSVGSVFVLEAPDEAAAHAFADGDPFHLEGVFARREVTAIRAGLGAWVPRPTG